MKEQLKRQLEEAYPCKIEIHAHTFPASPCASVSPEHLAKAYKEKGYDAVVITNHFAYDIVGGGTKEEGLKNYLSDYERAKKAGDECGINIILGCEVRFSENWNDYLFYGVDEEILSTTYDYLREGVKSFRENVKLPDSVFLQAHPFRDGMSRCDLSLLDGIEVYNLHANHNSRVAIAEKYAKENNLKIATVGSDYHDAGNEGLTALRTKFVPKDSFELASLLKSGDYIFECYGTLIVR